ncbi:AAA family ATPase, partial [Vibrio parahaemolyticus]
SKRMLTTGLQQHAQQAPHITLFDEIEIGLEPHRIARLLKHLAADAAGQYFLTTHSPVALRELTVHDLHIV